MTIFSKIFYIGLHALVLLNVFSLYLYLNDLSVLVARCTEVKNSMTLMADSNDGGTSHGLVSVNAIDSSNLRNQQLKCNSQNRGSGGGDVEQLAKARKMGLLELSPNDEVEAEIFYYQHRLLRNARARKPISGLSFLCVFCFRAEYDLLKIIVDNQK